MPDGYLRRRADRRGRVVDLLDRRDFSHGAIAHTHRFTRTHTLGQIAEEATELKLCQEGLEFDSIKIVDIRRLKIELERRIAPDLSNLLAELGGVLACLKFAPRAVFDFPEIFIDAVKGFVLPE